MKTLNKPEGKIAILGGGITGLTAAYTIAQARQRGASVEGFILEARNRVGGLIQTEKMEGFTVEGGPDSFITAKMEATGLCREFGLESELISSNDASRKTYILHRGRLEPLPDGLMFFVPTRLGAVFRSRLVPFGSKLAVLRDAIGRGPACENPADESVADFVRRHFGRGILDSIVDPLLAGVYGGDSEKLSVQALLPQLVDIEQRQGSLVRGMLKARSTRAPAHPIFTTLKGGTGQLVCALAAKVDQLSDSGGSRLFLNQRAEMIEMRSSDIPGSTRYTIRCQNGKSYEVNAILLALPALECARLLAPIIPTVAEKLAAITYTPAVTIALGYERGLGRLPRGFGFLVPRREARKLLACTFVHSKFSHRAPEGGALLRCFLGGVHQPDVISWSDEELISVVKRELCDILGITQLPAFHRIYRWPSAMPQYLVGHKERVNEIEHGIRQYPGLFLAGNAYHGVGIPDCILSARSAAEQAIRACST